MPWIHVSSRPKSEMFCIVFWESKVKLTVSNIKMLLKETKSLDLKVFRGHPYIPALVWKPLPIFEVSKVCRCTVRFRNFGALGLSISKKKSTQHLREYPQHTVNIWTSYTESQHLSHCDATRDETTASHYRPRYWSWDIISCVSKS